MAKEARLGSFDDLMGELPPGSTPTVEPIARKLRAIILDDFPGSRRGGAPGGRCRLLRGWPEEDERVSCLRDAAGSVRESRLLARRGAPRSRKIAARNGGQRCAISRYARSRRQETPPYVRLSRRPLRSGALRLGVTWIQQRKLSSPHAPAPVRSAVGSIGFVILSLSLSLGFVRYSSRHLP